MRWAYNLLSCLIHQTHDRRQQKYKENIRTSLNSWPSARARNNNYSILFTVFRTGS